MRVPALLTAFLCPPLYCAKQQRSIGVTIAIGLLWLLPGVGLVLSGLDLLWKSRLHSAGYPLVLGALSWTLAAALASRSPWARRWMFCLFVVILFTFTFLLYADIGPRSRMAADEGTITAMNSAIAIYYGTHNGTFPAHPGNHITPSPPVFQCSADQFGYSYDASTGIIAVARAGTECRPFEDRIRSFLTPLLLAGFVLAIQLSAMGVHAAWKRATSRKKA